MGLLEFFSSSIAAFPADVQISSDAGGPLLHKDAAPEPLEEGRGIVRRLSGLESRSHEPTQHVAGRSAVDERRL